MIELDCQQGTQAWFTARLGIPTASRFGDIVTSQGKRAAGQKKYICDLVAERLRGYSEEQYNNIHMMAGSAMEKEARAAYALETGTDPRQVGFIYRDEDRLYGASPDALVDPDGGVEIKCPKLATVVGYAWDGKVPAKYRPQVYGSLYISGRLWWDFFAYHPDIDPFRLRVTTDDPGYQAYAGALAEELPLFLSKLDEVYTTVTT